MPHDPYGRREEYWRSNEPRGYRPVEERRRDEERAFRDDDRDDHDGGRYRRGQLMTRQEAEAFSRRVGEGEWGWGARRHHDHDDHREHRRHEGRGVLDQARDAVRSWFGPGDGRDRYDRDDRYDRYDGEESSFRPDRDHRGRGPKGYMRSDQRIEEDVCERLTRDAILDASGIEVRVSDREVILAGTVATRDDKRRAERLAEDTPGVEQVQNGLRVDPSLAEDRVEGTFRGSQPISYTADRGWRAEPLIPRDRYRR